MILSSDLNGNRNKKHQKKKKAFDNSYLLYQFPKNEIKKIVKQQLGEIR